MQIEEKEYDQSFDWRIWKKLFPFMKPFRKYMIIALVFNFLTQNQHLIEYSSEYHKFCGKYRDAP